MRREIISQLPPELRAEIDHLLIERGFSGYEALEEQILAEHDLKIGKSTLHRYGQKLERKLAAIRASTEAARAIADAAPDDADQRSAAVISLVQSDLFDALVSLQEAGDVEDKAERVKLLSQAAKAISEASRASVGNKKWAAQVRRETCAQAVDAALKAAKKNGVSKGTQELIRRDILGIGA